MTRTAPEEAPAADVQEDLYTALAGMQESLAQLQQQITDMQERLAQLQGRQ